MWVITRWEVKMSLRFGCIGSQPGKLVSSTGEVSQDATVASLNELIDRVYLAGGGTIWVCDPLTMDTQIILRSGIILDFLNHVVTLSQDTTAFYLSDCIGAQVKNVNVKPYDTGVHSELSDRCTNSQRQPIIKLLALYGPVERCSFSRVFVTGSQSLGTVPAHCFDVIHLVAVQYPITNNSFDQVGILGSCNGVHLETAPRSEFDNAHIVSNLFSFVSPYRVRSMVTFSAPDWLDAAPYFSANTFRVIKGQSITSHTHAAVHDVMGYDNHFDHVWIWDFWYADNCAFGSELADWKISHQAHGTYISADYIDGLSNGDVEARVMASPPPVCRPFIETPKSCSYLFQPMSPCNGPYGSYSSGLTECVWDTTKGGGQPPACYVDPNM